MKKALFIELHDKQTDSKKLYEIVKEIWKADGNKVKDIESIELFFKPAENNCYYVINKDIKGNFEV